LVANRRRRLELSLQNAECPICAFICGLVKAVRRNRRRPR
jgi:hypothetical protein